MTTPSAVLKDELARDDLRDNLVSAARIIRSLPLDLPVPSVWASGVTARVDLDWMLTCEDWEPDKQAHIAERLRETLGGEWKPVAIPALRSVLWRSRRGDWARLNIHVTDQSPLTPAASGAAPTTTPREEET